jgi:peptide/nickel transport system permease protein
MATITVPPAQPMSRESLQPSRATLIFRYLRRNKSLVVGILLLLFLTLFAVIGSLTVNVDKLAYPLAVRPKQPPNPQCLFDATKKIGKDCFVLGTDFYGRDLLAAMVKGLRQTAQVGLLAGLIGTVVGTVLGFISAYFGGVIDSVIRAITEVLLPVPVFLIQVLLAGAIDLRSDFVRNFGILNVMALIVVMLAWMGPTRVIRAQVLSMRERPFVNVAKLSGMSSLEIIFKEILPNLLPFLGSAMVGQIIGAIFASFGLSVFGLGPLREPLIGNTIYYANYQAAFFNGWWWWPLWPCLALILIFGSLTLIYVGLDEVANPRIRRSE